MNIKFKRLTEVAKADVIELMNNPLVRRQMPLLTGAFNNAEYKKFIADKEGLWIKDGYGPWAFVVDGAFAGWGGLQQENGDADLALVLHPNYWGIGKKIYLEIVRRAFNQMNLSSITVVLPTTRVRVKGLLSLGFEEDGELIIKEERFIRYRLNNS